jgi:organic hydroperoxide reductase OsmC/OhrA
MQDSCSLEPFIGGGSGLWVLSSPGPKWAAPGPFTRAAHNGYSMRTHRYTVTNRWTGNLGTGTSDYRSYSRSHELSTPAKSAPIAGSSDPMFRGDRTRYNPEELLVSALSACHMLWALHYCADAGIVVTEYVDDAHGEMVERGDGSGEFTSVVLHPRMKVADPSRIADAIAIHARVHDVCAIARSVNFSVSCEPSVTAGE